MTDLIIPLLAALVMVILAVVLMPGLISSDKRGSRKKKILTGLQATADENEQQQARHAATMRDEESLTGSDGMDAVAKIIPGIEGFNDILLKSGMSITLGNLLLILFALIFLLGAVLSLKFGLFGFFIAVGVVIFGSRWYLKRKSEKRVETFINQFPDAVDMIVRSVRSGHPLNASLRMIADNMDAPISTEFRQVMNEVSFGRSLNDALRNLSRRIDQTDLQFFVVVLAVQQESGGNLGEILSNLSGILRKRKQMRLKIKALTAEGRMTAYILGALPILVLGALQLTSPDYLTPLFEKTVGNFVLVLAGGMILLTFFITGKMVKIDI